MTFEYPMEIVHYGIRVTWLNGEQEWLDDIPDFKDIENYLDALQEEREEMRKA
tara:strand:- start:167 stop:325 length:159 start_codon:yes stop_codon:yes gene_type:complete